MILPRAGARDLAGWARASAAGRLGPERMAVIEQFLRFGLVGATGMVVDTGVIYGTRHWLGLYGAGALSYLVAATWTWQLNRHWTFHGAAARGSAHRQWALFMTVNLVGLVFNRGTYVALVTWSETCAQHPVLAVAAGGIAGMFWNFFLSRRVVFDG